MVINLNKKATFLKFKKNVKILNKKIINKLINSKENRRICLHKKTQDSHQEMFIFQKKNNFFPPKKNTKSDQTFFIIEGTLQILVFNSKGKITEKIVLSKKDNLYVRVKKNVYHCDIPLSKYTIHLETKNCIFNKKINKKAKFKFNPEKILHDN